MPRFRTRWAYLPVQQRDRVLSLASELNSRLPSEIFSKEGNPHITIHPQFNIPTDEVGVIETELSEYSFEGASVTVSGVSCWPSVEKPMCISLDVQLSIESVQQDVVEMVDSVEGVNAKDPVPAHITLVRADTEQCVESWSGVGEGVQAVLRKFIWDVESRSPFRVTVGSAVVEQAGCQMATP